LRLTDGARTAFIQEKQLLGFTFLANCCYVVIITDLYIRIVDFDACNKLNIIKLKVAFSKEVINEKNSLVLKIKLA